MLGHSLPGRRHGASSDEGGDGMVIGDGQPQATAASDDEVHDPQARLRQLVSPGKRPMTLCAA